MNAIQILGKHNLSKTAGRLQILDMFLQAPIALSEKEIHNSIGNNFNRASIYRTLKIFTDSGILHPIFSKNEMARYILQKEPDEHLHFKCIKCDKVMCMPEIKINNISLPDGFIKKEANYLITGICDNCNP
ncbi:MAG: transcriptional repressor [Bacteroidales bacterium]|nr:transcriptional repressor [Bacteroidales bacterium]